MNERSIFSEDNGGYWSEARDEWPVPKSSTETWTPRADRRLRVVAAEAGLAARARPVTSRQRRSGVGAGGGQGPGDQVDQVGLSVLARRQGRSAAAPSVPSPPGPERPGPDAGDGPWTIEFVIEVTTLDA